SLFGIDLGSALGFGIEHPLLTPIAIDGRETHRRLNAPAEFIIAQPLRAGLANGRENGAAQERDKEEIVEMAGLQGGVLTIVGEAQELAAARRQRAGVRIHPPHRARYEERRGRAAALGRERRELVDFARLAGRLVLARGAEAEFSGKKPGAAPGRTNPAARIDGD